MLKLILGTAGTGKSEYIKKRICENASAGIKSLLIVPEQFSKTGEAEIFSSLEKSQFSLVTVFSFTSLLRDVKDFTGKKTKPLLTEAGKAAIAKKSLDNVYKHLNSCQNQRQNIQFSFNLSEIFDDFKRGGIDGAALYKIAQKAPNTSVKLKDIALIYSEYCAQIGDSFCDNEDLLVDLSETLPLEYTDKTEIFVDSFESFSFGQYRVLQRMMQDGQNVTISLTADSLFDTSGGTDRLCYTKKTATRLVNLAKKSGISIAPPTILTTQHRFKNETLKAINEMLLDKENLLLKGENNRSVSENGAFVNGFKNQYCEVSFVAAMVTRLVKNGYRYGDIAVVCPQMEKYENQLQESFNLAKIPHFMDQNRIISSSSPVMLVKSILTIMNDGLNEDSVLPLLKTQLTTFDDETISLLENYLYVWQDQGLDWQKPFSLSPNGIAGRVDEEEKEVLTRINCLVAKVQEAFSQCLLKKTAKTAGEILSDTYKIIGELQSEDIIIARIKGQKPEETDKNDLLLRQWEKTIECLEQLYKITAEDILKPQEITALFLLMIAGTKLGFAPETQDCVMVSTPQRMKIDAVKAVFVIGASQDIFPSLISESKLLNAQDRQILKDNNFELGTDFEEKFSFENLYFYKTLTVASEKVFVSYAQKNIDTQEILSSEIEGIKESLSLEEASLEIEDYCITKEFFSQYISETAPEKGAGILNALGIDTTALDEKVFKVLDLEKIIKLLGENIVISPSAAESYFKCAFGYFLQRILRIHPIEKANLTQREAGDYLHYVAQVVLETYKGDYYKTEWETVEKHVGEVVTSYIENTYDEQVRSTPRFAALHENMHKNALQLLKYMHQEQAFAEFRPIAFEAPIGIDGTVPPLRLKLEDGKTVSVVGVCDRIDVLQKDGIDYIRIVDYKTGNKEFKLDDIYNGISSQLLLYMSAILKGRMDGVENPRPAAVIYQPSDADFKFDKKDEGLYTAVGMAVGNETISKAFDTEQKGRFGVIKGSDKLTSLRGSEIVSEKLFETILDYTQDKIKEMAKGVYSGEFDSSPLDLGNDKTHCEWCQFGSICQSRDKTKERLKNNFKEMEGKEDGTQMD